MQNFLDYVGGRGVAGLLTRLRDIASPKCFGIADQAVVSATNFATTLVVGRFCGTEELGK